MSEQAADGGQAGVTGADAVAAFDLQVVQERRDQVRVELFEVQPPRLGPGGVMGEIEQQPHRVAVGGDRVWADPPLFDQLFGEEALHDWGQGSHGRSFLPAGRSSAARPSNTGVACKYQLLRGRNNWYYSDSRVIPMPAPSGV